MQLLLTNKQGQTLDLLNSRNRFILYKAEALHGINTDISDNTSPYIDGTIIESVRALPRSIELGFKLVGNVQESINYITNFIKSKQYVTLEEKSDDRDITIKGVATIPPYTRMQRACALTLTIYCGQPYWEDAKYLVDVLTQYLDLLYFPVEGQYFTETGRPFGAIDTDMEKTFINNSDTSVGMLIELLVLNGTIVNPTINCNSGEQVGWFMQLNLTLQENDELRINTVRGQKYITINGSETYNGEPILNYLNFKGNDWLQLETGENSFNIKAEINGAIAAPTNAYFTITYKGRYE